MLSQKENHIPTTFQLLRWRSVATSFETRVFSSRNIRMTRWSRDAKWCYSESKRPLLHVLYKRSNDFYWFDLVELGNIFWPWAIIWYDTILRYIHNSTYWYIYIYIIYTVILYKHLECTLKSDTSKYLIDDWALSMETVKPNSNTDIPNSITKKTCQLYMYIIWLIMICII